MSFSSSQYDPENRFMRCAMEYKIDTHSSRYLEKEREREREHISNYNSIPIRQTNKYPNSRLRSKTHSEQDVRSLNSPEQKKDIFEDNFPSLLPKMNPVKTPIMLPLRSPQSNTSPKKNMVNSITSISIHDGKLIQKEIVTIIEEPPPLTITPSKWSDLLRSSAK